MQSIKRHQWSARLFLFLSVVVLAALAAAAATAQEPPTAPTPQPDAPARQTDRTPPPREAVILSQTQLPDGATNTVIQIPAEADAYIASERPFQNFGSGALYLGYNLAGVDNYGAERILIRFDVDTYVPDTAVINEANLRLRLSFASPVDDSAMGVIVRRLATPWTENAITWSTEPEWTDVDSSAGVGSQLDWYMWDVTDVVGNWQNNIYPNNGLELIGDETIQQRERAFYARETTTDYYPRLTIDYTVSDDDQPPVVTVDALPAYSPRSFTVSWSGADQGDAGIAHYDVQYRVDGGAWIDWLTDVTETSAEFGSGENGRFYEFRARGEDNVGNVEAYGAAEAATTVDAMPPSTSVDPLPAIISGSSFTVSWSGSDPGGSGIAAYDVQYRLNNGDWVLWQAQTTATSATLNNPVDGVYAFEVRGIDGRGQVEPFLNEPEAATAVDNEAPFIEAAIWLPIVIR